MSLRHANTGDEYDEPDRLNEHWNEPGDPDGVFRADRERIWREGHRLENPRLEHVEPRPPRYWPLGLLVLVVAGLVVGAYFLGWHNARVGPVAQKEQVAQNKAERKEPSANIATKHYDSGNFSLGFDFPNNWIVSDTKDKLTLTSPSFTMQSTKGATDGGHVVLTVQNQQSSIPGYPEEGATASLASTQVTYKHPSDVQRKQSYLSYLGYSNGDGIDALYLTGDNTYQSGDTVPVEEVVQGNPLISVTFAKCTKSFCMGGSSTPLTLKSESWDDAKFKTAVINMLQSLVLH